MRTEIHFDKYGDKTHQINHDRHPFLNLLGIAVAVITLIVLVTG